MNSSVLQRVVIGIWVAAGIILAGISIKAALPSISTGDTKKNSSAPIAQNLQNIKATYNITLSGAQENFLQKNKFLVLPAAGTSFAHDVNFDDMIAYFDKVGGHTPDVMRKPENARFVTPDIVLHTYHKFFEMTLEELEKSDLAPTLQDFLRKLSENLAADKLKAPPALRGNYERLQAQVAVARTLAESRQEAPPESFQTLEEGEQYLKNDELADSKEVAQKLLTTYTKQLPPPLQQAASKEIDLIYAASIATPSPLFGIYKEGVNADYTQFTPRSHYTKKSILRAYFRAMMYLGRSNYFLAKNAGIADVALLTHAFDEGARPPREAWQKIMNLTTFYAGSSDDITYLEWKEYLKKINLSSLQPASVAAPQTIKTVTENLAQLRTPKILSDIVVDPAIGAKTKDDLLRESLAFRIFGQRFTFDAWMLNTLTCGSEKCEPKLPSTPSALFVPAAFGDNRAQEHAHNFLKTEDAFTTAELAGFDTKLASLRADITRVKHDEWFASMGSAWLYVLSSLTKTYDQHYPLYMRAVAFLDKQIQTFLGSYTELKHDTLLYAKQSYAEKGGGGPDGDIPPIVKGYVEPNMEFWKRLQELLDRTQKLFDENHVFENHSARNRLSEFMDTIEFYTSIAQKEYDNTPVSDEDYEKLRVTNLEYMADPFEHEDPDDDSGKVALVADIHTDGLKGQILYEATGEPYLMLAYVDNEKSPRVVIGPVYNHYEFTKELGGPRMTDSDWRKSVYEDHAALPTKNFWYQSLLIK